MRLNNHHISYDPEWVVEVSWQFHAYISRVQRTRATEESYALLVNELHALSAEVNRQRQELDSGKDMRVLKSKGEGL